MSTGFSFLSLPVTLSLMSDENRMVIKIVSHIYQQRLWRGLQISVQTLLYL